ncbi:NfeD family protein [Aeoliella sp.]|uniref:NfeD family protein n=1 Tax=Aeoliella sp. TaxID=2795800 RepID=UPI003CCB8D6E
METIDPLVWCALLVVAGFALLVLEVLLPSGGILSILAGSALVASIVIAFRVGGPTTGFTFVTIVMVLAPAILTAAFRYLPYTPIGRALLGEPPKDEDVAPTDPRRQLIGKVGVARSKMLPSGSVEIDGQMLDAVSKGQAIEPGQNVQVIEVRGNRVVVRLAPDGMHPGTSNAGDLLNRSIEELGIDSLDDPLA